MNPTKNLSSDSHSHPNPLSRNDLLLCTEFTELMRTTAAQCKKWSEESTSPDCKVGMGTSAVVCAALAESMEKCMTHLGVGPSEQPTKKGCCG